VDIRFDVKFVAKGRDGFLSFEGLTGRQRETLALFYRSLMTGRMAQTGEIITSLDTPVDLVPMGETEEEEAAATVNTPPRLLRVIRQLTIYLVLAALIFTTLGQAIWTKFTTVPIQHARISAPLLSHPVAREGYVDKIKVAEGDIVRQGDVLVVLSNPSTARALAEVRSRISAGDRRVAEARDRLVRIDARIAARRDVIVAQIAALEAEDTPSASRRLLALQDRLADFDAGLLADVLPLFETRAAIQREIDTLEDTLRRLRRERGVLRDAEDAMNIRAATSGLVTEIPVTPHQFVARGTPVVVLEDDAPRVAVGWVKPELAAAIYPGMPVRARVNLGAQAQSFDAEIRSVIAGTDPERGNAFGILLEVSFTDLTLHETRTRLAHGAPVEMRALRPTLLDRFSD